VVLVAGVLAVLTALVVAVVVVVAFSSVPEQRVSQAPVRAAPEKEPPVKPAPQAQPVLPPGIRPPPPGFVALFNGKNLAGWRKSSNAVDWEVTAGLLRYTGTGKGYLATEKSYADFELDLEFRIPGGGNSGVFLRLTDFPGPSPDRTRAQGIEVQILDDAAYPASRFGADHACGAIVGLQAPFWSAYRGAGVWQRFQITCRQRRVVVRFNGQEVIDVSPQTHQSLSRLPLRGPIGLQNWGTPAEFRNLFLKELTSSP
jgi:hypothetical protein